MEIAGVPIFPPEASTQAQHVDLLLFALLGMSALVVILIFGLIILFVIRYRRRSEDEIPEQIVGSTRLEIFWTAVPLVVFLGLFFWASRLYLDLSTPPDNSMEIYAVGKQWMWKFQHLGGQEEINELHVPLNQPVKMILTSQDMIHSFYVPAFRIKQDVLPGRYTSIWFQATTAGTYHLFCGEYCGTDHSQMIGSVIVMDPAAFQTWLSGGAAESLAAQGQKIYQQYGCNTCHRSDSLARAPKLDGLYGQPVLLDNGQTVIADDSYIRESILNPTAKIVSGYQPIMPSFQGRLSEDQIRALIAYIKSIGPSPQGAQGTAQPVVPPVNTPRPTPIAAETSAAPITSTAQSSNLTGDAAAGQQLLTQLRCHNCHRPDSTDIAPKLEGLYGQPVKLTNGQTVAADDAYIRESILNPNAKVVAGYDAIMTSFQGKITDQQIAQIIAYIKATSSQPKTTPEGSPTP